MTAASNPYKIKDGELLPIIGGPHDGLYRKVSVIIPTMAGGVPSSALMFGPHQYRLDSENRRWVYVGCDAPTRLAKGEGR